MSINNPVFLNDEPLESPKDSGFEIHEKIASEIVKQIELEPSGRVAILGDWGSGKSTVLSFIQKNLKQNVHFVSFDAWSHSGSSLRRNFLHTIISQTLSNSSVNENERETLDKISKKISGQQTFTHKIEQSEFSLFIAFVVLFISIYAACGVGIDLFISIYRTINSLKFHWSLNKEPILLLLNSFRIFLSFLLAFKASKMLSEKRQDTDDISLKKLFGINNLGKNISDILAYLLGRPNAESSTQIDQTEVIDSVTFEKEFDNIVDLLLKTESKDRLVIAIDNLDRLSIEDLKDAWDSIQIFAYSAKTNECRPNIWIILPISKNSFVQLCNQQNESSGALESEGILSKLFIRQFDVPSPILTDWKKVFVSLISEAFLELSGEEKGRIFAICNQAFTSTRQKTPREAKKIINRMVANAKIHPEVSLESLALFEVFNSIYSTSDSLQRPTTFTEYMTGILNQAYPGASLLDRFGGVETVNELSMLLYGVFESEKAKEVLLATTLENAKNDISNIHLGNLIHGTGSWDIIMDWVDSIKGYSTLDSKDNSLLTAILKEVASFPCTNPTDIKDKQELLQCLLKKAPFHKWPLYKQCSSDIIQGLNGLRLNPKHIKALTSIIQTTSGEEAEKATADWDTEEFEQFQDWCEETILLLNGLDENQYNFELELNDFGAETWALLKEIEINLPKFNSDNLGIADSGEGYTSIAFGLAQNHEENETLSDNMLRILSEIPIIHCSLEESNQRYSATSQIQKLSRDEQFHFYFEAWNLVYGKQIKAPKFKKFIDDFKLDEENFPSFIESVFWNKENDCLALIDCTVSSEDISEEEIDILSRYFETNKINIEDIADKYFEKSRKQKMDILKDPALLEKRSLMTPLLKGSLKKEDYAQISHEDLDKYIDALTRDDDLKCLGKNLAEAERIDDFLTSNFIPDIKHFVLYIGFLTHDPQNDPLKEWLSSGLSKISSLDWSKIFNERYFEYAVKLINGVFNNNDFPSQLQEALVNLAKKYPEKYENTLISELLPGIDEQHFLLLSQVITNSFEKGTDWKRYLSGIGDELLRREWIGLVPSSNRPRIVETILRSYRIKYYIWLKRCLLNTNRNKFRGSVQEIRTVIRSIEKNKSLKRTKGLPEVYSRIQTF